MKILVGFDSSNTAKAALEAAISHGKAYGAGIVVAGSMTEGKDSDLEAIQTAESDLKAAKAQVEEAGLPCDTHLLIRGMSPGEDLVKFAEERGVELIVVGIRRRSKVGKLLMGSTAQYVILNAHCPVLTVK